MDRRRFLRRTSTSLSGIALLAGCLGTGGDTTESGDETTATDTATNTDTDAGTETEIATTSAVPTTGSTSSDSETPAPESATTAETGIEDTTGTDDGMETEAESGTDTGGDPATGTNTTDAESMPGATANATVVNHDLEGTLTVATYSSFTGEGTAGTWLKSAFEARYPDTTVEFTVPENGINQYIQRASQGAPIDADLYVGLNTGELVRVDQELDDALFATADGIAGADAVKDGLRIDPDGRAIPYDTGYISVVYDEGEVENPGSFDALLDPAYENALIAQNAQQSDPGRAFLLWSIIAEGEDGYLDYWQSLLDNGVQILSDWEPAYNAYTNGEAPMVVSYSTDQVFYHGEDVDMSRHQVGFLNDEGYANPEAMALFSDSDSQDLGRTFMAFMLTEEAQAEIATRNVQFPAVAGVEPGGEFGEYAIEPPEPVTMSYDDLAGNVEDWIDTWAREVVGSE